MEHFLLKLSGEALANGSQEPYVPEYLDHLCEVLKSLSEEGKQIAIVLGGGNYWRGRTYEATKLDRAVSDHIGMLATVMNALLVSNALNAKISDPKKKSCVMTRVKMDRIAEEYQQTKALSYLQEGRIVFLAGGTGSPFFTTDTGAALSAAELHLPYILKGTLVNGVYDKDPKVYPDAKFLEHISYDDFVQKKLQVMDTTAATLCESKGIKVKFFDLQDPENILRIAHDEPLGSTLG